MKLIIGLGNPDPQYAQTRHNVGFMAVDCLTQRHHIDTPRSKFHSAVFEGQIAGDKCLLLKPTTYMNRSGLAVGEAVMFYKLEPTDVIIVVDDVALPTGQLRLRASGGAGGHNGLSDIERALGTQSYPRLRIGIDAPGRANQRDYVLGRFTPSQRDAIDPALDQTADAIECWIRDGIDQAMTRYNAAPI